MNWKDFVEAVSRRAGDTLTDEHIEKALTYLSGYIPAIDARHLGPDVPARVAELLADDDQLVDSPVLPPFPGFAAQVDLSEAQAHELVLTVCRQIDSLTDGEGQKHFRRNLTPEMTATFERSHESRNPPTGEGHELADGRPGASRPLSEASPAQTDSIAASDDPHGATKLSGAEGTTQEREKRTLAEGKPGSTRPLSKHEP